MREKSILESAFNPYVKIFHFIKVTFSNKKLLTLIGALTGLFAILSFSSEAFLMYFSQFIRLDLRETSIPITFLLISIISFSFLYLQSGGNGSSEQMDEAISERSRDKLLETDKKLEAVWGELAILRSKLAPYESKRGLSEDEKQQIIDGAIAQASEDAIRTLFNSEISKLQDSIKKSLNFERLTSESKEVTTRLRREIIDLRLRSNINLLIGMSITAIGLYLLWTTVSIVDASALLKTLASEGAESNDKFFKNFILPIVPRITLVIFVEIFAYFFLQLYKNGLSEIKYFQNELTNIESKLISVEFSYITENQEALKTSLEVLSHTERNFVLEKGQTTVELEKAKSESELTRNIIKMIPDFLKKANK